MGVAGDTWTPALPGPSRFHEHFSVTRQHGAPSPGRTARCLGSRHRGRGLLRREGKTQTRVPPARPPPPGPKGNKPRAGEFHPNPGKILV